MSILKDISLGNDIVDLSDSDTITLTQNQRFIQRVFAPSEQESAEGLDENQKNITLWKIWAAKEASYKALRRIDSSVIFSHSKFVYHESQSAVFYENTRIDIEFEVNIDYIHASAKLNLGTTVNPPVLNISNLDSIESMARVKNVPIVESYSRQSSLCRTFAVLKLREYFHQASIEIHKKPGIHNIPEVYIDGNRSAHLISLSHHGRYCAVLFL